MKTFAVISFCLLVCASCLNDSWTKEEPRGFCGTADSPSAKVHVPDVFKGMCATCHLFDKDITGPKLKDVLDRVPSKEWLRAFITNQDSLIQIEDEYTLEIMTWSPVKYNHNFSGLAQKDLDTLMNYITQ